MADTDNTNTSQNTEQQNFDAQVLDDLTVLHQSDQGGQGLGGAQSDAGVQAQNEGEKDDPSLLNKPQAEKGQDEAVQGGQVGKGNTVLGGGAIESAGGNGAAGPAGNAAGNTGPGAAGGAGEDTSAPTGGGTSTGAGSAVPGSSGGAGGGGTATGGTAVGTVGGAGAESSAGQPALQPRPDQLFIGRASARALQ